MTWRPPDREDRQVAALWVACAGLALLMRPVWLAGAPALPACPWHVLTGWPCPGCGATRAMVRLLHADVPGALRFNPLFAVAAIGFVAFGLAAPLWFAAGGRVPCPAPGAKPGWLAALALTALSNWAWLCASGV